MADAVPGGPTCNLSEDEQKMVDGVDQNDPNRIGFTLINILRQYPEMKLLYKQGAAGSTLMSLNNMREI